MCYLTVFDPFYKAAWTGVKYDIQPQLNIPDMYYLTVFDQFYKAAWTGVVWYPVTTKYPSVDR